MASLRNRTPKESFRELLTINNNAGITSTLALVRDGDGHLTALSLSTTQIALNGMVWPTASGAANSVLRVSSTNNQLEWVSADSLAPYDLASAINGKPAANAVVLNFVAARSFTIPAGMVGSRAKSTVNATATTVFTIKKNGANVGTLTFAAANSTGVFAMATQTSFVEGDVLSMSAPATADATLADIAYTIVAKTV